MVTSRVFRGWFVLAGIFVIMTMGSGFAFYAQGVFLDALVVEQGFSVGMAGAGTGFFFVVSGVFGYWAGGLISRFDVRAVMIVGATIASVGIALLGQIRNEWQMFGVFLVYGGGYALAGLVPGTSLVTRWFQVRRSIALSIASTGLSVGGIVVTPVIAQLIDARSLVDQAPTFAVAYWLGVVPVTLLLIRPSPEGLGLLPDGAVHDVEAPAAPPGGTDMGVAIRTAYFRLMSAAFILVMGAQVGALQHIFKLTKDAVDVDTASLALVVVTSTSVVFRILGGLAATRVPLPLLTSFLILVQSIGITIVALAEGRAMILVGIIVLGMAMGNLLMLHPLILADAFGVRDYPRIYGLGSLLMIVGVGLGPFAVGLIRDQSDYRTAFLTMAAVAVVGLAIFRLAERTRPGLPPVTGGDRAPEAAPSEDEGLDIVQA